MSLAYYTEAFYRNYPDLEKIGIVMIEDYARRKPGPIITFAETLNEEGAGTVASIWPRGGKITDEIMSLIKNYGGPYQIIGDMEDCSFIIVEQLDADAMLKIQRCVRPSSSLLPSLSQLHRQYTSALPQLTCFFARLQPDVGLAYFNEAYARKFGDKGEPAAPL